MFCMSISYRCAVRIYMTVYNIVIPSSSSGILDCYNSILVSSTFIFDNGLYPSWYIRIFCSLYLIITLCFILRFFLIVITYTVPNFKKSTFIYLHSLVSNDYLIKRLTSHLLIWKNWKKSRSNTNHIERAKIHQRRQSNEHCTRNTPSYDYLNNFMI